MSIRSFVPELWSSVMQDELHKELVLGKLCNRNWEGEIRAHGDTLHINMLRAVTVKDYTPGMEIDDPETLDGTGLTLRVDHSAYFHFNIDDVDAAQSKPDVLEAAMRMASHALSEDTEKYILQVMRTGAGLKESAALTPGKVYELLVRIKTIMDEHHVPRRGRAVVMPPSVEAELLLDQRFVTAGCAAGQAVLTEGSVARAAGFDIYISADLKDELIALTGDAVTFAQQLYQTEAYRCEKSFADGVKGLSSCGARVVMPECLLHMTLEDEQ